jgi:transcriptional regulator with XRE-family HTH domain/Zn-dependent peptidase ImmA (M78 family)
MSAMADPTAPWDTMEFRTITSVDFGAGTLEVDFADGGHASVPVERLVPSGQGSLDWQAVQHDAHEISVPRDGDTDLEVSWMDLRALDDPEFSEYLVATADEEARQVGARLRAIRESHGLTAKEVAERAGIAPMSLSRIELGRHDVVYRTLRKILAAMGSSLEDLADEPPRPYPIQEMKRVVVDAGVGRPLVDKIADVLGEQADRFAAAIEEIFGWDPDRLIEGEAAQLDLIPATLGRFKSSVNQNPELATYTLWAYWLALLADQAIPRSTAELPENASAIRDDVLATYGDLRFESLLRWSWDYGIVVLPLQAPGEFHGAVWSIQGRAVVVLKQRTPWESRWTFDLAHELAHLARHVGGLTPSIVEIGEIDPMTNDDADEQEASDFAGEVLLGDPDKLAQELAHRTGGSLPRLKGQIASVAAETQVEPDALANYMAWRLALEGQDWWATAATFQDDSGRAPEVARNVLRARINWDLLDDDDTALLSAALDWEA